MSGLTGIERIVETLRGCNGDLLSLNSATEEDFLAVGASLREILTGAERISEMATSVADLMQSGELERHVETLRESLSRMHYYLDGSGKNLARSMEILRSVMGGIDEIKTPLLGFKRIVKHLRVLSVSTKIESARFSAGDSSFSNIANDVEKLSALIDAKSTQILGTAHRLHNAISETLSRVSTLATQEHEQARVMLDGMIGSLSSLSEKHTSASMVSHNIADSSEAIRGNVGEVVRMLQFHDITRQQIEHVIETFGELCERIGAAKNGDDVAAEMRSLCVADICRPQVNQLSSARHDLVSAIGGTTANLKAVTSDAIRISREISSLTTAIDPDAGTFLATLKGEVTKIANSLRENVETNTRLSTAVEEVAATVNDLTGFVGGIEDIGTEIELIALNARIKAAQTGTEGAALGVLAEGVRNLSDTAREQTTPVSRALAHINGIAESLGQDQVEEEKATGVGLLADELHGLLNAFGQMDEQIALLISTMERAGKDLEKEIGSLVAGITVHVKTERALEKIIKSIEDAVFQAGEFGTPIDGEERGSYLKELEERYTMHKERSVHRSSIRTQGPVPPLSGETFGELGDNIELF